MERPRWGERGKGVFTYPVSVTGTKIKFDTVLHFDSHESNTNKHNQMDIKIELPLDRPSIIFFIYNIPQWLVKVIVVYVLIYIGIRLGFFH